MVQSSAPEKSFLSFLEAYLQFENFLLLGETPRAEPEIELRHGLLVQAGALCVAPA